MKRINPFSPEFEKIKKVKLRNEFKHEYNINQSLDEGFRWCWWKEYFPENSYIRCYISPYRIWDRYQNQLGLEIFNFEEDMEYLENLPEDYNEQNIIIESYNELLELDSYYNNMYFHYFLCKFLDVKSINE